jgi:hypothetical protein
LRLSASMDCMNENAAINWMEIKRAENLVRINDVSNNFFRMSAVTSMFDATYVDLASKSSVWTCSLQGGRIKGWTSLGIKVSTQGSKFIPRGQRSYPGDKVRTQGTKFVSRGQRSYPGDKVRTQGTKFVSRGQRSYPGDKVRIQGTKVSPMGQGYRQWAKDLNYGSKLSTRDRSSHLWVKVCT